MIKCSCFCFASGERAKERAIDSIKKVQRYRKEIIFSNGKDFCKSEDEALRYDPLIIAFFNSGELTPPWVHGLILHIKGKENSVTALGEFSMLAYDAHHFIARRDHIGTRPIYIDESEGIIVASDHRFLNNKWRLLPPNCSFNIGLRRLSRKNSAKLNRVNNYEEAVKSLSNAILQAVEERVKGKRRIAVAFSGGLDSSTIAYCAKSFTDVVLVSGYLRGARDQNTASRAADMLDLPFLPVELSKDELMNELRNIDLPFRPSKMDLSLWCLYTSVSRVSSEMGAETILLGQLADELFGGYMKYLVALNQDKVKAEGMMLKDLIESSERAFIRDEIACSRWIEPLFPFSDERIVSLAVSLPIEFKISGNRRKAILRDAARQIGLPFELVEAPKKAAQYSSGIAKLVS